MDLEAGAMDLVVDGEAGALLVVLEVLEAVAASEVLISCAIIV